MTWVDPDDAPEVTAADLERGVFRVDGREVTRAEFARSLAAQPRRGRPPTGTAKPMLSLRVDADVLAALRATGPGWQTRVNALLREAVEKGKVRG